MYFMQPITKRQLSADSPKMSLPSITDSYTTRFMQQLRHWSVIETCSVSYINDPWPFSHGPMSQLLVIESFPYYWHELLHVWSRYCYWTPFSKAAPLPSSSLALGWETDLLRSRNYWLGDQTARSKNRLTISQEIPVDPFMS